MVPSFVLGKEPASTRTAVGVAPRGRVGTGRAHEHRRGVHRRVRDAEVLTRSGITCWAKRGRYSLPMTLFSTMRRCPRLLWGTLPTPPPALAGGTLSRPREKWEFSCRGAVELKAG